jgi:hypothetical protein
MFSNFGILSVLYRIELGERTKVHKTFLCSSLVCYTRHLCKITKSEERHNHEAGHLQRRTKVQMNIPARYERYFQPRFTNSTLADSAGTGCKATVYQDSTYSSLVCGD